jgi:hypothetical protein
MTQREAFEHERPPALHERWSQREQIDQQRPHGRPLVKNGAWTNLLPFRDLGEIVVP